MSLESRVPEQPIYRIGRWPNPWLPPDWAHAHTDGTFGNRFDDPQAYYRVIYASTQRLSCFLETLARFRPDLSLVAELAEIEGENDFTPFATVPSSWLLNRVIGIAHAEGQYADIYAVEWVAHLRRELAPLALSLGIADIYAGMLQAGRPRQLTQHASLVAFRQGCDGIFYRSRFGHTMENWAIFEPFPIRDLTAGPIADTDPDLLEALRIFEITMRDIGTPSGPVSVPKRKR